MIYGNISGVKSTILNELENLIKNYDKHLFIDKKVLFVISKYTTILNREISIFISRSGLLLNIAIGDSMSAPIHTPNANRRGKLSGIRCIHTHPSGNSKLSNMDISALQNLKLDCMCAVAVIDGMPIDISVGYLNSNNVEIIQNIDCNFIDDEKLLNKIIESEKTLKIDYRTAKGNEKAIVCNFTNSKYINEELDELTNLCKTADLNVVDGLTQILHKPNSAFYMGSGKLEELKRLCQIYDNEYVIINNELTGSQINNLEKTLGVKVMDRPMLILDIFSKHATTNEGKLQIELARLKYTLPKLLGQGKAMSRIGGGSGIATKGAGETKSETDRRHIRNSILDLTRKIEKLEKDRDNRRKRRKNSGLKSVALVGYTNAGKSTLMNRLTKAGVLEENKLFATLDPVTRKIFVDLNKEYLLTDTVGFIDNLPHEFIEAFKSTLIEAVEADVLLHVVDGSSTDYQRQIEVVNNVLKSLGIINKPMIIVFNKVDLNKNLKIENDNVIFISAKNGYGIDNLRREIENKLFKN